MPVASNLASAWGLTSVETGDLIAIRSPGENPIRIMFSGPVQGRGNLTDTKAGAVPGPPGITMVSSSAKFVAEHNGDDLRPLFRDLIKLITPVPRLGRRPLVTADWADTFAVEGWVERLSFSWPDGAFEVGPNDVTEIPIVRDVANLFSSLGGGIPTGFPRSFRVDWTLKEAQDRAFEVTGAPRLQQTKHIRIGSGETFESVAWDHLRDPMKGILLRPLNPQVAVRGERPGDVIKVLDRTHPAMREPVAPRAAMFQGPAWRTRLQEIAEDRLSQGSVRFEDLEVELGLR
ncbi:MAG: hypothetical protein ACPGQD_01910 [Planctomycetota bacterium]